MFISETDKQHLMKIGIDFKKDIPIFIENMKALFLDVWRQEFTEEIKKIKTIEDLNRCLNDYPSTGGKAMLDSTFTCLPEEKWNILTEKSRKILDHLYRF